MVNALCNCIEEAFTKEIQGYFMVSIRDNVGFAASISVALGLLLPNTKNPRTISHPQFRYKTCTAAEKCLDS